MVRHQVIGLATIAVLVLSAGATMVSAQAGQDRAATTQSVDRLTKLRQAVAIRSEPQKIGLGTATAIRSRRSASSR